MRRCAASAPKDCQTSGGHVQPKAMSRIIMSANPRTMPAVALPLCTAKLSGTSSAQTTAIIAPEEKASAKGRSQFITGNRSDEGFTQQASRTLPFFYLNIMLFLVKLIPVIQPVTFIFINSQTKSIAG